jgi:hypothetical protein
VPTVSADTRREWLRSGAIGTCVAIAVIALWAAGRGSAFGPTAAAARGGSDAQHAADLERRQVAQRIEWIVVEGAPMGASASARACLTSGPACSRDGMLDVDTTRMRTTSLGTALAEAVDPKADGYMGPSTPASTALARRAGARATAVGSLLGRWLTMGCGSSTVDGTPAVAHPAECDGLARQAIRAIDDLGVAVVAMGGGAPDAAG